jgi:hypothetical protein
MSIAAQAKQVYDSELKARLEAEHRDEFVAIEPESKSFFVAGSFIDAGLVAKKAYPNRKSFVIRIGHEAAFHLGAAAS